VEQALQITIKSFFINTLREDRISKDFLSRITSPPAACETGSPLEGTPQNA